MLRLKSEQLSLNAATPNYAPGEGLSLNAATANYAPGEGPVLHAATLNFGPAGRPMPHFGNPYDDGSRFYRVKEPKSPYSGVIPHGLVDGKRVHLKAKFNKHADQ